MGKTKQIKHGAGILPFASRDSGIYFLFHTTFKGRRRGLLVDFGGGSRAGETPEATAAREFIEETEGMYFGDQSGLKQMKSSEFKRQQALILQRIHASQRDHPERQCRRRQHPDKQRKEWQTFFVEIDYRPVNAINRAWAEDDGRRFRKRRRLVWLSSAQLLEIYRAQPDKLWTRVRDYQDAPDIIRAIEQAYLAQHDVSSAS